MLKQLHYILGDGFRAGLQDYFKQHAWGNTTIEDFLRSMDAHNEVFFSFFYCNEQQQ